MTGKTLQWTKEKLDGLIRKNGLDVASTAIRHINTGFVLEETGKYEGIFADAHLLDDIGEIARGRAGTIRLVRETLAGDEPACQTGEHCTSPFSCEFISHCSACEPAGPEWPISELPNSGARLAAKWGPLGINDIRDLPEDAGLNDLHTRRRWPGLHRRQTQQGSCHETRAIIIASKRGTKSETWRTYCPKIA